jgi:hypothetical protein
VFALLQKADIRQRFPHPFCEISVQRSENFDVGSHLCANVAFRRWALSHPDLNYWRHRVFPSLATLLLLHGNADANGAVQQALEVEARQLVVWLAADE